MTRFLLRILFTYFIFSVLRAVERRFGLLGVIAIVPIVALGLVSLPAMLRVLAAP